MLSSVFGVDGGLEDGGNAAEVLKKSEARRRVLYCIVDDVVDDVDVYVCMYVCMNLSEYRPAFAQSGLKFCAVE
jgi:hypothetical protein